MSWKIFPISFKENLIKNHNKYKPPKHCYTYLNSTRFPHKALFLTFRNLPPFSVDFKNSLDIYFKPQTLFKMPLPSCNQSRFSCWLCVNKLAKKCNLLLLGGNRRNLQCSSSEHPPGYRNWRHIPRIDPFCQEREGNFFLFYWEGGFPVPFFLYLRKLLLDLFNKTCFEVAFFYYY